jgi:hypothetical protein
MVVFIMGVEHGGSPLRKDHVEHIQVDRVTTTDVRHTPVPETAPQQAAEGDRAVPVTVVTRAELEALQEKAAQLEKRRATDRARVARWRERHPDEAKRQTKDNVAAYRARRKQA